MKCFTIFRLSCSYFIIFSRQFKNMYRKFREWLTSLVPQRISGHAINSNEGTGESTAAHVTNEPAEELEVQDELKEKWIREQEEFMTKLQIKDVHGWSENHVTEDNKDDFPAISPLKYIGGVDISFIKGDNINACAAFVVVSYPEMEVVYEDLKMIKLTAPYIAGFLAFREAHFLVDMINELKDKEPDIYPQVVMVDGNGILHPRGCGLACHIGVMLDLPCLGVAKNLFHVDGIEKNSAHEEQIKSLQKGGDTFLLVGESGTVYGEALRSSDKSTKPVYISPGHMLSIETATWVVKICCQVRVPEPTRQADIRSREYLREHTKPDTEAPS